MTTVETLVLVSVKKHLPGSGYLKPLCLAGKGMVELVVVPTKGNTAEAHWQAKPPAKELTNISSEALHNGYWDFIRRQWLDKST